MPAPSQSFFCLDSFFVLFLIFPLSHVWLVCCRLRAQPTRCFFLNITRPRRASCSCKVDAIRDLLPTTEIWLFHHDQLPTFALWAHLNKVLHTPLATEVRLRPVSKHSQQRQVVAFRVPLEVAVRVLGNDFAIFGGVKDGRAARDHRRHGDLRAKSADAKPQRLPFCAHLTVLAHGADRDMESCRASRQPTAQCLHECPSGLPTENRSK